MADVCARRDASRAVLRHRRLAGARRPRGGRAVGRPRLGGADAPARRAAPPLWVRRWSAWRTCTTACAGRRPMPTRRSAASCGRARRAARAERARCRRTRARPPAFDGGGGPPRARSFYERARPRAATRRSWRRATRRTTRPRRSCCGDARGRRARAGGHPARARRRHPSAARTCRRARFLALSRARGASRSARTRSIPDRRSRATGCGTRCCRRSSAEIGRRLVDALARAAALAAGDERPRRCCNREASRERANGRDECGPRRGRAESLCPARSGGGPLAGPARVRRRP